VTQIALLPVLSTLMDKLDDLVSCQIDINSFNIQRRTARQLGKDNKYLAIFSAYADLAVSDGLF
jgi:hypothetical protein